MYIVHNIVLSKVIVDIWEHGVRSIVMREIVQLTIQGPNMGWTLKKPGSKREYCLRIITGVRINSLTQ